jgi:O-antigen/teichoic acid export membrane protein
MSMLDRIVKAKTIKTLHVPTDGGDILIAAKGGGIIFIGALFEYAGRFIFGIVVARVIGAEQFGLYNLALTPLTILSVVALLGLRESMTRYIPIFVRQRDEEGLWGTLQIGLGLTMVFSLVLGGGLFVLAGTVANKVFHIPELEPYLRIAGLIVPFAAMIDIIIPATQGFKQMQYKVYARDIALTLIKMVVAIILLAMGIGTLGVMVAHAVATIAAFVMLLYFLHRLFPLSRPITTARYDVKQILGLSLPVYLSYVMDMLGGNLEVLLLGILNTATAVGIFAAAARIGFVGNMFHRSVLNVSPPIVSDLYSQEKRKQLERFYQVMTKWTFTFNVPLFIGIVLFPGTILSVFGDSFVAGSVALTIMALGFLSTAAAGICGVIINMTGYTWLSMINSIGVLALTVALNLILVPSMGVVGAAIAVTVTSVALNLARLLEVLALFRLSPYNKDFLKPVLAGLIASAGTLALSRLLLNGSNLVYLVINLAFLVIIYFALILLFGLSQEDQMVLERLSSRLRAPLRFLIW